MFRLGLVMLRKYLIWTTIGTVFVHTVIPPLMLAVSMWSCAVSRDV
jgi:hypothetical protein